MKTFIFIALFACNTLWAKDNSCNCINVYDSTDGMPIYAGTNLNHKINDFQYEILKKFEEDSSADGLANCMAALKTSSVCSKESSQAKSEAADCPTCGKKSDPISGSESGDCPTCRIKAGK
jgi:hypothetical protein